METVDTRVARHAAGPSGPGRTRIPFLDVARGWAMIGVVVMNAPLFLLGVDKFGKPDGGEGSAVATVVDTASYLVFADRSRTLLMLLLGIGVVLTWRSATRRGERPTWLLVRRYVTLFVVFGLAHRFVFEWDILTHYALFVLVLVPLLPLLLRGPRWWSLALAAVFLPFGEVIQRVASGLPDALYPLLGPGPTTLTAFAVGVWLARLPEIADDGTEVVEPDRAWTRPGQLVLVSTVLTAVAGGVTAATWPVFDEGFNSDVVSMTAFELLILSAALLYFAVIWWLVDRDRTAARALSVLAPIGRMSLTVYLGSTAVFLLAVGASGQTITTAGLLGVAYGYVVVMAVVCPLWLRVFRYGPAEWLWRCLTYLRPLPLLRRA